MIQGTIFNVENDGNIDFSINRKTCVQEPVKDSVFSRRDFHSRSTLNSALIEAFLLSMREDRGSIPCCGN